MGERIVLVSREINGISIDVEIDEGDGVYFEEEVLDQLHNYDIESIKNYIYAQGEGYAPYSVMWELTNRCNLKCRFCYINCNGIEHQPYLTLDECRSFIDDLVDSGMLFCTLTGGECFLHPHFTEIYTYLKQKGVLVTLFTNATLIKEEHFDLFSCLPPYKIEISIYGASEKGFSEVTASAGELYLRVLSNIKKLKEMGIQTVCKTPLNILTEDETPLIRDWCKANGIPFYNSPELLSSYAGENMDKYLVSPDVQRAYYVQHLKDALELSKLEFDYKKKFDCAGGRTSMFIAHNRKVYPCSAAFGINELSADIFPEGMKAAVSELRRIINKKSNQKLGSCVGCIYCDVCDHCIVDEYTEKKDPRTLCSTFRSEMDELLRLKNPQ